MKCWPHCLSLNVLKYFYSINYGWSWRYYHQTSNIRRSLLSSKIVVPTWLGHLLSQDRKNALFWRFCLNKYAYNGPFNETTNFSFPGFIRQIKAIKFSIKIGLNLCLKKCRVILWFIMWFPISRIDNDFKRSNICIFLWSFPNVAKTFVVLWSLMASIIQFLLH